MKILWDKYVFRRGNGVHELWDKLFERKPIKLLYIAGKGFDVRAQSVMEQFADSIRPHTNNLELAELILIGFKGYELEEEIAQLTQSNETRLLEIFNTFSNGSNVGTSSNIEIGSSTNDDEEISASSALAEGIRKVLDKITDQTDIVLDVSSLPRVISLALLTNILLKIVPRKDDSNSTSERLKANGVNFQVLVAEDAHLDGMIKAEDPSNDLIQIPGFTGGMHVESVKDWPLVWFPILGENRVGQLQKLMALAQIPDTAEVCPILPHPSNNPRRADNLLVEYTTQLFTAMKTPTSNILYVHESNPFEAYRQLLGAMMRYKTSMSILGGCRFIVTPLGSKLVTLGAGLACFEMRPANLDNGYAIAIPYAEPKRYVASVNDLKNSRPEIAALLLTGEAYDWEE